MIYKYDYIVNNLKNFGYFVDVSKDNYTGANNILCHDSNGYKYIIKRYYEVVKGVKPYPFAKNNPFVIYNINQYLVNNNIHFICISNNSDYKNNMSLLKFRCTLCGEIVTNKWINIYRNDKHNRRHLVCPNCDYRKESLHASVLKQMFLHNYPDTIVEDKSYINKSTNKICPTDIVNHRLKIAIEIQSQWHDYDDIKIKDKNKMDYWISSGYKFYALDIRDYSILEMCQVFFNINEIPDYIDLKYGNRSIVNAKRIQNLLNNGLNIADITEFENVSSHQIYDAIHTGKITYPEGYAKSNKKPILQYDSKMNFIKKYDSISIAEKEYKYRKFSLTSKLRENNGKTYFNGYYWFYEKSFNNLSQETAVGMVVTS